MSKKQKRLSVSQKLFFEGKDFFKKYENKTTQNCYVRNFKRFIQYCREFHKVQNLSDCKAHIQNYINYLVEVKGMTPSTVHTYITPASLYFNTCLDEYSKPKRCTADYTRGRSYNGRIEHSGNHMDNPRYQRLVSFQREVGLRRAELKRLKGADLILDEFGYYSIRVKSKGGRIQTQRILNPEYIKPYFEGKAPDEKIFHSKEFSNTLNLHAARAECARNAYQYYVERLKNEGDTYRRQLEAEVRERLRAVIDKKTGKPKRIKEKYLHGKYFCRGKNKLLCQKLGIPWVYDKLSVMAVSVFHLAHNRPGVTVESYLTAR